MEGSAAGCDHVQVILLPWTSLARQESRPAWIRPLIRCRPWTGYLIGGQNALRLPKLALTFAVATASRTLNKKVGPQGG